MKKSVLCVGVLFYVFLLLPVNAHAYLDMGTGSMALQFLVAGIAGGAVFLRLFWTKIKGFLARNKAVPETESDTPVPDNNSKL
jgi:nitrate reductase gamma subunit